MVGGTDPGDPVAILPIEASEGDLERRKVSQMEESDSDEGLGESNSGKKRQQSRMKARRARRKAYRPYYQLTEEQRRVREDRERSEQLKPPAAQTHWG